MLTGTQAETTLVVPARHEEDSVGRLLELIHEAFNGRSLSVLFVDDSDNKATYDAIAAHMLGMGAVFAGELRKMPTWKLGTMMVSVFHRQGDARWGQLAGAVIDGIEWAGADTHVVVMDADGQHPPATALELLRRLDDGNDIVVASRYIEGGSNDGLDGFYRRFVSKAATMITRALFPRGLRGVTDPMTGFFAFKTNEIDTDRLSEVGGFKILFELLTAHPHTRRAEVPLQFQERIDGESKAGEGNGLKFIQQLFRLRLKMLPTFVNFALGGGFIAVIGALMLAGLIKLGVEPHVANGIQLVVTLGLNFMYSRHITWHNEKGSQLHWQMFKFLVTRGATLAVCWVGFVYLMEFGARNDLLSVGWRAQVVNAIMLVEGMILNFILSNYVVFKRREFQHKHLTTTLSIGALVLVFLGSLGLVAYFGLQATVIGFLVVYAIFGTVTSILELRWRNYGRRTPETAHDMRFVRPESLAPGKVTAGHSGSKTGMRFFSVILPALREEAVIGDTIRQLLRQTYEYYEIIVTLAETDYETIAVVRDVMREPGGERIRLVTKDYGNKGSKPAQMNYALKFCKGDFITVADAETHFAPEFLELANATIAETNADVLQGGVQLMNLDVPRPSATYGYLPAPARLFMRAFSRLWWALRGWFCVHNVLEYWFWFSGRMFYQVDQGFVPLGGNTVVLRADLLREAGGWPIHLTEDCALGVKLTTLFNAKVVAVYEAGFASREETPTHIFGPGGLIRQRMRWDQGFWAVLLAGEWRKLPTMRQRVMALYILGMPLIQAFNGVMMPFALLGVLFLTAPAPLVLLMFMPIAVMIMSIGIQCIGLATFGEEFEQKVRPRHYLSLVFMNLVYQVILAIPAVMSIWRHYQGNTKWEKTTHVGNHVVVNTQKPQSVGAGKN